MSDTSITLRRKIASANDLQAVVSSMKALAASSIGQYEASVNALADYYRIVGLGLGACYRAGKQAGLLLPKGTQIGTSVVGAVVFGSDQGLVGQFNDVLADHTIKALAALPGEHQIWAVGERIHARLTDAGLPVLGLFTVPSSVEAIAPLIGRILVETEAPRSPAMGARAGREELSELHLFYNTPISGAAYEPTSQRLLPLDEVWQHQVSTFHWPTKNVSEVIGGVTTLRALIREYLFVSLFRVCAKSLASENASRLAAMQRADKNIDELLETLNGTFQRMRQSSIDEELFEVISGFEALGKSSSKRPI